MLNLVIALSFVVICSFHIMTMSWLNRRHTSTAMKYVLYFSVCTTEYVLKWFSSSMCFVHEVIVLQPVNL